MVTHFPICIDERFAACRTHGCRVIVDLFFFRHVVLVFAFLKNFADNFTFGHDVIVKFRHDIVPTIYNGVRLVFAIIRNAVARETANAVLVDDSGPPRALTRVVVVHRSKEGLKVAY